MAVKIYAAAAEKENPAFPFSAPMQKTETKTKVPSSKRFLSFLYKVI